MLLRSARKAATPLFSFEKASANILAGNYDGQRVLILLKTPELALKLMNAGIALPSSISAICPTKTIAARSNARSASTMLRSRPSTRCWKKGVAVTAQMTPEEPNACITTFLKPIRDKG